MMINRQMTYHGNTVLCAASQVKNGVTITDILYSLVHVSLQNSYHHQIATAEQLYPIFVPGQPILWNSFPKST